MIIGRKEKLKNNSGSKKRRNSNFSVKESHITELSKKID
jgi:hypothetical protein